MTPHPRHRAVVARRMPRRAWARASVTGLALLVAASVGQTAYADKGSTFGHSSSGHDGKNGNNGNQGNNGGQGNQGNQGNQGSQPGPTKNPQPAPDEADDSSDHVETLVTEPVDFEYGVVLKATPQPLTAYELPFPCGELWSGSTRAGHAPSVRSVDFNSPGDLGAPVVSSAAGIVTTAVSGKKKPSYGQHVIINHGNDESTMYAHLDSVTVAVGQQVEQGTEIGTLGSSGNSSGAHLHYEQRSGRSVVDSWFHGARMPRNSSATSQNCREVDQPDDTILAGNILGSTPAELIFFQRKARATFLIKRSALADKKLPFGEQDDQPFVGDWDGDGRVNPGVRNPVTRVFSMRARGKVTTVKFGKRGDVPVAGNWDGVGAWEIGVRRPNSNLFVLRFASGEVTKVALGDADDLPLTGDWDGDGRTDLGVYDPTTSTFTLSWLDPGGLLLTSEVVLGGPGDIAVTGDWDGNGVTDLGVWNPTTKTFAQRLSESPTAVRARVKRSSVANG